MIGAFAALTLWSIRNRVAARLRRLRQPRYAIGLIVGLLYFGLILLRPTSGRNAGIIGMIGRNPDLVELAGVLLLFLSAAAAWVLPSRKPALAFTPPEVQFLFTAPVTRRQLIQYKLLRGQLATLFGTAIMTIFFQPPSLAAAGIFFAGTTLLFTALTLHTTGVSLSRASLGRHGRAGLARQWLPVTLVLAAAVTMVWTLVSHWPTLAALEGRAFWDALHGLSVQGPLAVVLWPFRALVRLPLAPAAGEFLRALPAALAILAINFIWVTRSDTAFEEASAELAQKVARFRERSAPALYRARPTPFRLAPTGRAELALLWKNLILVGRFASWRLVAMLLPVLVIGGVFIGLDDSGEPTRDRVVVLVAMLGVMTTTIGPYAARNDLRQDLAHLSVLKTWPVSGATLVRGEVLAPTVMLSAIAGLIIVGVATVATAGTFNVIGSIGSRVQYGAAAFFVAVAVIAVQIVVQNAVAVLFPGWVAIGPARAAGVDAMGQRMIMFFGTMLILPVVLLPAAVVAALVAFSLQAATGAVAVAIPAAIGLAIVLAECLLICTGLGRALDRTDPSAVDAAT